MSRKDYLKRLIAQHNRHLERLREQEAKWGSLNVPTHILTQIEDIEAKIENLQAELRNVQDNLEPPPTIHFPVLPKSSPVWLLIGVAVTFLTGVTVLWLWYKPFVVEQSSSAVETFPAEISIAVIGHVEGNVKVQRGEGQLITASPGLSLFYKDVITTPDNSWANIYCLEVGLFTQNPGRAVVLTCEPSPPEGLELIAKNLPPQVEILIKDTTQVSPPSLEELSGVSRAPGDIGSVPILLSPRQLTASDLIFRWTKVPGAAAYTLKIKGNNWEYRLTGEAIDSHPTPFVISNTVTVLETVYPTDAPPLEPGVTYDVTLQAHLPGVQTPQESNETLFFELVDSATSDTLAEAEAQIRTPTVPIEEQPYLLSLLYQQHGLWAQAAHQMEIVAHRNHQSPPLLQLGDLYLRAGLVNLAEANYQQALATAHDNDDLFTQATALTDLGRIAYVTQAKAEAAAYFEQALALYQQLGNRQQVDLVQNLLAEVTK